MPTAAPITSIRQRQLWELPEQTSESYTSHCTPFTLPSNGVLTLASNSVITLTSNVVFQPQCTDNSFAEGISTIPDIQDPFYASTTPQTYVVAATTVIAWVLVVMLVITPRTSFFGSPAAGPGFSNGRGIIGGATGGGTSLSGVGSRPWLQKVAALAVAVSLTIATADTFKVAHVQYADGFMNASALRDKVMGSLEVRITRVISDVFLWLAQVQTLIRLFPRHKEKVLIKWIGFALIIFDSTFSCLNSFLIDSASHGRHFEDAIPALSYLFELALGLLYAAWVIYYAMTKRRYAFYHPMMRSICLIALLSLIAVLTPVVFFVTDVSNQDIAGWGDYFRWVGAAAASVVVWEWVERIEALERVEKKDGILGREIFDGDEMLDVTPSGEDMWGGRSHARRDGRDGGDEGRGDHHKSAFQQGLDSIAKRFRRTQQRAQEHFPLGRAHSSTTTRTPEPGDVANGAGRIASGNLPKSDHPASHDPVLGGPMRPPAVASPVSRADTASAASTVYMIRYDTGADVPQPVRRRTDRAANGNTLDARAKARGQRQGLERDPEKEQVEDEPQPNRNRGQNSRWHAVSNPFKRKRTSPPAEVQQAREAAAGLGNTRAVTPVHNFSRWDVKGRLGVLAAETGERIRDRHAGRHEITDLPVTIIPAQPRGSGRTWSPELLHQPRAAAVGRSARAGGTATLPANSEPFRPSGRTSNQLDQEVPHENGPLRTDGPRKSNIDSPRTAGPPRADDLSPVAGHSGRTVVVPAPARSPLRISTLPHMSENNGGSAIRTSRDNG